MTFRPVGGGELARLLGVGRARAGQLSRQEDFPAPVARLSNGSVWNLADLVAWAKQRTYARELDLTALDEIAELERDPGRLVGRRELEVLIDRSKTQIGRLVESDSFPAPIARLGTGAVWALSAVQAWAEAAGRDLNRDALEQEQPT